jgi:hypothetical protein
VVPTELQERANATTMYKPSTKMRKRSWKTHATMRAQSLNGACFPLAMALALVIAVLGNDSPFRLVKKKENSSSKPLNIEMIKQRKRNARI